MIGRSVLLSGAIRPVPISCTLIGGDGFVDLDDEDVLVVERDGEEALDAEPPSVGEARLTEQSDRVQKQGLHALPVRLHRSHRGEGGGGETAAACEVCAVWTPFTILLLRLRTHVSHVFSSYS